MSGGYVIGSGTVYSCLRCNFGFQPVFAVTTPTGNPNNPICATMGAACGSAGVILGGLPSFINAVFSCHVCNPSASPLTYPTTYMEYDAIASNAVGEFLQYSFPVITASGAAINHGFRCAVIPTTVTIAASTASVGNQVTNCAAFGVLSADRTANSSPTITNSYCLACQSGTFPIYLAAVGSSYSAAPNYAPSYIVTSCVASANCDANAPNKPFNSCGRCSLAGLTLATPIYYAYSDWRLINCLPSSVKNCFINNFSGSSVTASVSTCNVCQSGFYKNYDGYCDQLTVPNSATGSSFVVSYYYSKYYPAGVTSTAAESLWIKSYYLLSFFNVQYGVSSCATSYVLAPPFAGTNSFCAVSQFFANNVTLTSSSTYITNCYKYVARASGLNTVAVGCAVCNGTLIPKADSSNCVTAIANCQTAQTATSTLCQICNANFFNINGVCGTTTIPNCQTHSATSSVPVSSQTCIVCNPGFYLSSNNLLCTLGSIVNCGVYTQGSGTTCISCLPNYIFVILSNALNYCYPLNGLYANCQLVSNAGSNSGNGFQLAQINCNSCFNSVSQLFGPALSSSLTNNNQPQNSCLPFISVANCLTYNQNSASLNANSLTCSGCSTQYYLVVASNICNPRTLNFTLCLTYSSTSDVCATCVAGYFITNNGLKCTAFPTGIPNCAVYSAETTCASCISGYYLSVDTCLLSTVINNCVTYSSNYTCSACSTVYFLNNSTSCVNPTASACLTYSSISACASCSPGLGLSTTTVSNVTTTSCASNRVANCAVPTSVAPFTCVTCSVGFYPVSGSCVAVTAFIVNCLIYDTNATCLNCSSNSLLNSNRTVCNQSTFQSYGDQNCQNSFTFSASVCAICNPGYSFSNGSCAVCPNNTVSQGCQACDPFNSTVCLWCVPGTYYMDGNMNCQLVQATPNNSSFNQTSGSVILFILNLVVLFLISG